MAARMPAPPSSVLATWFGVLVLLSAIAVLHALLFPAWPSAPELSEAQLRSALTGSGVEVEPLPSLPALRSEPRALSRQLGWSLPGGAQLWIVQGSVRRYQDLQASFLASPSAALRLQNRVLNQPLAGSASGLIQGHPALQTCLVPQSVGPALAGVTRGALIAASDPRRQLKVLRDPEQRRFPVVLRDSLDALLGPRSFSCVLVTLRSNSTRPLPDGLWQRLLSVLQQTLQRPAPG